MMSYRTEWVISVRPWGAGLSKGRGEVGGRGVAGGLEQGGWGLGRVSIRDSLRACGAGTWAGPRVWGRGGGGGGGPSGDGTDVCSLAQTLVRTDGQKFPPLFYRTSSPLGPLPKRKDQNHNLFLSILCPVQNLFLYEYNFTIAAIAYIKSSTVLPLNSDN